MRALNLHHARGETGHGASLAGVPLHEVDEISQGRPLRIRPGVVLPVDLTGGNQLQATKRTNDRPQSKTCWRLQGGKAADGRATSASTASRTIGIRSHGVMSPSGLRTVDPRQCSLFRWDGEPGQDLPLDRPGRAAVPGAESTKWGTALCRRCQQLQFGIAHGIASHSAAHLLSSRNGRQDVASLQRDGPSKKKAKPLSGCALRLGRVGRKPKTMRT